MKRLVKFLVLAFLLLLNDNSHAQSFDLCGLWLGYNYQCYTINPDNSTNFYTYVEVVQIEQNGTFVSATKLIGDDCVEKGQITWSGAYTATTFPANFVVGSPNDPNNFTVSGNLTVVDSNKLETDIGLYFIRATCNDLSGFDLDLENLNFSCPGFANKVVMPNIFTPNGDEINDEFAPINCANCEDYKLSVFNRWGNLVFESLTPSIGWDGKNNHQEINEGTYFWLVSITNMQTCESIESAGFLTLIR